MILSFEEPPVKALRAISVEGLDVILNKTHDVSSKNLKGGTFG